MPHFIIECSTPVLAMHPPAEIMRHVHQAADATGLFGPGDIKVRIRPYDLCSVAGQEGDFIHVFGHIMQGRTVEQRRDLSQRVIRALAGLFPSVPVISMNVPEFERATYCNRVMLDAR
jgi:5-carboxymethyl-2-hydroxymuconate isomerase